MAQDRQTLIAKIAHKGVITPYEAIYLQYLNKQHLKEQEPDIEKWENPYVAADKISQLYTDYDLSMFLTFDTLEDISLYDGYRWAANTMTRLDRTIGELGYKAVALLNELRYFQSEYAISISQKIEENVTIEGTLFEFSTYSRVYQQQMTFTRIFESFIDTMNFLVISIDNILTLNYYLQTMADQEDFSSLKFLQMLLTEEEVADEDKEINFAKLCYGQVVTTSLENNHKQFVSFMRTQLSAISSERLEESFEEKSLEYVKRQLST